jgi:hypothetical protein
MNHTNPLLGIPKLTQHKKYAKVVLKPTLPCCAMMQITKGAKLAPIERRIVQQSRAAAG